MKTRLRGRRSVASLITAAITCIPLALLADGWMFFCLHYDQGVTNFCAIDGNLNCIGQCAKYVFPSGTQPCGYCQECNNIFSWCYNNPNPPSVTEK